LRQGTKGVLARKRSDILRALPDLRGKNLGIGPPKADASAVAGSAYRSASGAAKAPRARAGLRQGRWPSL